MKKLFFAIPILAALALEAKAARIEPATPTYDMVTTTHTCFQTDITSHAAVNVGDSSLGLTHIWVQNLDSTADITCSPNVNISTSVAAAKGAMIGKGDPGGDINFPVKPSTDFYCRSEVTGTVASTAAICRWR